MEFGYRIVWQHKKVGIGRNWAIVRPQNGNNRKPLKRYI